jgi:hypothetical protein
LSTRKPNQTLFSGASFQRIIPRFSTNPTPCVVSVDFHFAGRAMGNAPDKTAAA